MKATATYTVKKWVEETYCEMSSEVKMTRASVEFELRGEIAGSGFVEYLMFYRHFDGDDPHKSSASSVGLIRFDGMLRGQSGSFVMDDHGEFEDGAANSNLRIVQGSGTGALAGIQGTGF